MEGVKDSAHLGLERWAAVAAGAFVGIVVNGQDFVRQATAEYDVGTTYTDPTPFGAAGENLNGATGRHAQSEHAGTGSGATLNAGDTHNRARGVLSQRLLHLMEFLIFLNEVESKFQLRCCQW